MKRWRNFTQDGLHATEKIVRHAYILLHIARRNLFQSPKFLSEFITIHNLKSSKRDGKNGLCIFHQSLLRM